MSCNNNILLKSRQYCCFHLDMCIVTLLVPRYFWREYFVHPLYARTLSLSWTSLIATTY